MLGEHTEEVLGEDAESVMSRTRFGRDASDALGGETMSALGVGLRISTHLFWLLL